MTIRARRGLAGHVAGLALLAGLSQSTVAGPPAGQAPSAEPASVVNGVRVLVSPASPQPGDLVLVRVTGVTGPLELAWHGHPVPLFPDPSGVTGLVGIDLEVPPGPVSWRVARRDAPGGLVVLATGAVAIRARSFPTQRLTLPPAMVDLDAATLARVEAERLELRAALAAGVGERLWRGRFRPPVESARPTGGFGLRRLINGQPRSPHTGFDWAAPAGTPVTAVNHGRVALVAEHFFAGRNLVLDHGLGLFTLYYHLDESRVRTGEAVAPGQVIGTVGATGRVTGAHLHFGVLLGGARVDPEALLALVTTEEAEP